MDDGLAFWRQLGVTKPLPPNGLLHTERKRIAAGQLESPQNWKYTKAFASLSKTMTAMIIEAKTTDFTAKWQGSRESGNDSCCNGVASA
jgi:hypothetical protein